MTFRDIADMRTLLVELGYRVPIRDYSYRPKPKTEPMQIDEPTQQHDRYGSSATTLGESCVLVWDHSAKVHVWQLTVIFGRHRH